MRSLFLRGNTSTSTNFGQGTFHVISIAFLKLGASIRKGGDAQAGSLRAAHHADFRQLILFGFGNGHGAFDRKKRIVGGRVRGEGGRGCGPHRTDRS